MNVQRIRPDSSFGEDAFGALQRPRQVAQQRASALRFGDPRVLALLLALILFRLLPGGFSNRDLRQHVAPLIGLPPEKISPGRMTYDLRRLRLHGLIERIPRSRRYQVTDSGFRTALFLTRSYARLLRPGLSTALSASATTPLPLRRALDRVDQAIDQAWRSQQIAA